MSDAITLASIGFVQIGERAWQKPLRGHTIEFRELRQLGELEIAERMQREVMQLADADVIASSFLVIAPDTGGFTVGAYEDGRALGVAFGYGGYLHPEPFLYSDFLAVVPEARSLGVGFELKRLQAMLALERGFQSVRWTVDPLRAINARLNFERLGALGIGYTRNKYGADFGAGFYGGMPTDRLLLRWPLRTQRTAERLTRDYLPRVDGSLDSVPEVGAATLGASQLAVTIPADIDQLVRDDFEQAMRYRMDTRTKIESAFEAGYVISGTARSGDAARLLLEPAARFVEDEGQA